ncbi:hypothetical protein F511_36478 [Dorcoceras hygrometricum]|uniref:Uncharacterized protein n=1 Tax=Dorcoceras hygrometricum TaxID=472368 RepID=A0A2Z7BUD1_9LAMI|nr:hypothetical protein F511_36478 [Dorcoceras hygrometricum]
MPPPNYWQNTNNPYLTPFTYYGYHNPQPNDSPMEKEPATPTSVRETQLSERETPIDLEHLDKVDVGGEGEKKRLNWSKPEDESGDHVVRTKKTRNSESGASNTSSNQNVSIDLDVDDEDTHPIGQKATKREGKSKVKSDIQGMTVNFNTMCEQFNEYKLEEGRI